MQSSGINNNVSQCSESARFCILGKTPESAKFEYELKLCHMPSQMPPHEHENTWGIANNYKGT